MDILRIVYPQEVIETKRKYILNRFKSSSSNIKTDIIETISSHDLHLLFKLYDEVFFDSWFQSHYMGQLKFSFSRRMTRSAGMTLCPKNIKSTKPEDLTMEIRIGIDFFFNYKLAQGSKLVCGIETNTPMEALQLVFEHELCHVIEFINYHSSKCSGEGFKTMAKNLFGHQGSHHALPSPRDIAIQKYGFKVGDKVTFIMNGKKLHGVIHNITKRATVMVKDKKGIMIDDKGNRYTKYYVPLSMLK